MKVKMGNLVKYLAIYQISITLIQHIERLRVYNEAFNYARSVNKPLIVAGGPWGDTEYRKLLRFPGHPPGDICIDISAGACTGASQYIQSPTPKYRSLINTAVRYFALTFWNIYLVLMKHWAP